MSISWVYLFLAGFFEIILAVGLKSSQGFTRFWPSVMVFLSLTASVYTLSLSAKVLPISLAYAIWTGIGAVGVTLFGMFFLQESLSLLKVGCIFLITLGMVGLKFA